MSSQAISLHHPSVQQPNPLQLEQNQHANNNSSWLSTAAKVTLIAVSIIASIVCFTTLPIASASLAIGTIAILAIVGMSCFSKYMPNHSTQVGHQHHYYPAPVIPWYNRIFTSTGSHTPFYIRGDRRGNVPLNLSLNPPRAPAPRGAGVPVVNPYAPHPAFHPPAGGGRGVGLGRGHNPPPGPAPVGLGRGHNPPPGPAPVGPAGPSPVGLGRGHNPPPGPGPGPVGPGGRGGPGGIGRGHFH